MHSFPENIQGKLGFGFMRLPTKEDVVDVEQTCQMVDTFLANGFTYFDTAHGYLNGQCESLLKTCLVDRYPRDAYVLADKLSHYLFEKEEDILPLFQKQLELSGVDYFDFYLMHAQNRVNYEKCKACHAYELALFLREEGKIRHFGISFHDKADVLENILTEYPQIEVVQLQFNYVDYDDPTVESRKCYEVCQKHGKPVIVMEPVQGGLLAKLPPEAQEVFDRLNGGSAASYAIRFAAGFEDVMMVLSGMSSLAMMEENCGFMKEFKPLNEQELCAVKNVRNILCSQETITCTACRYCTPHCPQNIPIPDLFSCYNTKIQWHAWNVDFFYNSIFTKDGGKASSCIGCGTCEELCPQHLPIRKLLVDVAKEFEKES